MTTLRSLRAATAFVRQLLKQNVTGTFSVGSTPVNGMERSMKNGNTIFIRWTGGVSYSEVKDFIDSYGIELHAGRGSVMFALTRRRA